MLSLNNLKKSSEIDLKDNIIIEKDTGMPKHYKIPKLEIPEINLHKLERCHLPKK